MIKSIKHKALKKYWESGVAKGLNSQWLPRLKPMLDALEAASQPSDMNFPGAYFHSLKGDLQGFYSVRLTGNYRIVFQFEEDGFTLVDIVDYH
jgi:proteic killer suppression protein